MAIKIEVLSVNQETKPGKNNTSYQQLTVAYKNLSFQGKVEGRNLVSYAASTKSSFETLSTARAGDVFDVETEKNAKGFIDWVSVKKSNGSAQSTGAAVQSTAGPTYAGSTKSTYETPEERAKKQIYIVRQSSLGTAERLLSTGAKSPPAVDDVIKVAKQLESYVFGDNEVDEPDTFAGLEDEVE